MTLRCILISFFSIAWSVASLAGTLDTPEQLEREQTLLRVLNQPEMRAATRRVEALYRADPRANTAAGKATIRRAAHSITVQSVYYAFIEDVTRPAVFWNTNARHRWHGMDIPNSGYGIENPDNIYQVIAVAGGGRYVLHGKMPKPGPIQIHLEVRDSLPGLGAMAVEGFRQLDTIQSEEIKFAEDGSFDIFIDSDPKGPRLNHLSIPTKGVLQIGIRQLLTDWAQQPPVALRVERLDASPPPAPRDERALAKRAAAILDRIAPYWLDYNNRYIYSKPVNHIAAARQRPGGRGLSSSGHYLLSKDEAMLITVDSLGSMSFGIQITDPWGVAYEYIRNTSSLNNVQSKPDSQGVFTFVISAKDPGVVNWLDAGGHNSGIVTLRWQGVSQGGSADQAIRQISVVKLNQLDSTLKRVTTNERRNERLKRAREYEVRLTR
ncbi:MAG: hypothetical protein RLZZ561_1074 [Pseudomonadota bacterium]